MNLNLVTTPSSGDFNLRLSPFEEKPTSCPGTECLLNKGGQVIQPDPPKVFQLHQLCVCEREADATRFFFKYYYFLLVVEK